MLTLYLCLFGLLLFAVYFLGLAYYLAPSTRQTTSFLITTSIFIVFSMTLYLYVSDRASLNYWLKQGNTHYQVLKQLASVGGIDGLIAQVQQKLVHNPHDKAGWIILGKLYVAKKDNFHAKEAFAKAHAPSE